MVTLRVSAHAQSGEGMTGGYQTVVAGPGRSATSLRAVERAARRAADIDTTLDVLTVHTT